MLCEITVEPGYLKAELFNRNTVEETRSALAAIKTEAGRCGCSQILISVHASQPIFKVEQSGLLDFFRELGEASKYRIAMTGDSEGLRLSQQYIVSIARRHGLNVRSFPNQRAALEWFKDRRWLLDRRLRREPWARRERRQRPPRRAPESARPG